jgi:hypothetical protein
LPSLAFSRPTKSFSNVLQRTSSSYNAGEEKELYRDYGNGFCIIIHEGDGDSALTTRIYVDDSLEESISGDCFDVFFVAFNSSISIRTYSASYGDFYNSTVSIAGFKRE